MGQCCVAAHTVGSPDRAAQTAVSVSKKLCRIQSLFCQKAQSQQLVGGVWLCVPGVERKEGIQAFGCGAVLMTEFCANRKPVPHPLPPFPFSHHGQASCSAACPWVRKGERGKGMGQCLVAAHTVGSPDSCLCKQNLVQNPVIVLSENPVTTVGWWCVVVC